jgi:hypothetical protein
MKPISLSKDFEKLEGEDFFNNTNENHGKNKKKLKNQHNKSYSTVTSTDKKSSKKTTEDDELEKMGNSLRLYENIDYAKKIKQAKEMEDLKKILEKWNGQRFDSPKKQKKEENEEYEIIIKDRKKKNYKLEDKKNKKEIKKYKEQYINMNLKYKYLLIENEKMKEALKMANNKLKKLNQSLEGENKLKSKIELLEKNKFRPIVINIKDNYNKKMFSPKKVSPPTIKKLDGKKMKEELKILNKTFDNKITMTEPEEEKNKKDNNKKLLLDEDKARQQLYQLNKKNLLAIENEKKKKILEEKNKRKSLKAEIIKGNDESILEKLKERAKLEMDKKGKERNNSPCSNEIKIIENDEKEEKFKLRKKNSENKKKFFLKKNDINLKELIKKSSIFLDKNDTNNENFIEKLNFVLELDKYLQNEILINKDDNLMLPEQAVYYIDDVIIRFLGYFGSELTLKNMKTYIEKNPTNYALRDITFRVICSGLATQKIYRIIIDNKSIKNKFIENTQEYLNFLENIKSIIANKYNISESDIYFFGNNLKNFEIYLLINNKKLDGVEDLLKEFYIKISSNSLLNNVILSSNIFEKDYSKGEKNWPKKGLMRGGKKYEPPYGWLGIALKVKNKFGKTNGIWLGKENKDGEWAVAYHGIGIGKGKIFEKLLNIFNGNLKDEEGKLFKNELNVEKNNNKYPYCGEGVYLSPNIEDAAYFSDKVSLGFFTIKFQFAFMARVNQSKIRSPGGLPVEWILNGNNDEIRPYRLLFKIS